MERLNTGGVPEHAHVVHVLVKIDAVLGVVQPVKVDILPPAERFRDDIIPAVIRERFALSVEDKQRAEVNPDDTHHAQSVDRFAVVRLYKANDQRHHHERQCDDSDINPESVLVSDKSILGIQIFFWVGFPLHQEGKRQSDGKRNSHGPF